jgi:hypothetical protein
MSVKRRVRRFARRAAVTAVTVLSGTMAEAPDPSQPRPDGFHGGGLKVQFSFKYNFSVKLGGQS